MSKIAVPQVEYVGGSTPQESAALLNERIMELKRYNPTFEREGLGFWITYNKDIQESADAEAIPHKTTTSYAYARCLTCPHLEHVSDRVKWGLCRMHNANVNFNKAVCESYWNN